MTTSSSANCVTTVRVIFIVWIALIRSYPPRASMWRATMSFTVGAAACAVRGTGMIQCMPSMASRQLPAWPALEPM